MSKICVCFGTRPEIIKLAPIISGIKALSNETMMVLVHTGQHYDKSMSESFIQDLHLTVNYNLKVKQTEQAHQTGLIMARFECVLIAERPDIVVVLGDTNSALGCALAAAKNNVKVAHVEAGCRSYDRAQQEEINRMIIDHIATVNFAATKNCVDNLHKEGIKWDRVWCYGHPILDLLDTVKDKIICPKDFPTKAYALLTLHRLENIGDREKLKTVIQAIGDLGIFIVWPVHPHTLKQIKRYELERWFNHDRVRILEPVPYLDSLGLIKHARFVLTDSGGVQQECALLGTPCITLRDRTEWPETIWDGMNRLVGCDVYEIRKAAMFWNDAKWSRKPKVDLFGSVGASKRIVDAIMSLLQPSDSVLQSTDIRQQAPA
jgi:UDP-N-acetylglucosamine 2-epimerase (non-hydrolysing)